MKPVEQMTCEELEAKIVSWVQYYVPCHGDATNRALELLAELKSRRLAQGAG